MVAGPVLILTRSDDITADRVVLELDRCRVPVIRLDLKEFPLGARLRARLGGSYWEGTLDGAWGELSLDLVHAVYYRRPGTPEVSDALTDAEQEWAERESLAGIVGILSSLPRPYVNHPARNAIASNKLSQLSAARTVGLAVPETIVTSDAAHVLNFVGTVGTIICKPLVGGLLVEDGIPKGSFTSVVDLADLDDGVAASAHLFQEFIDKEYDVRLTVVDDQMFGVAIRGSSESTHVDWRRDYGELSYQVVDVPLQVRNSVQRLTRCFGLVFGALDFSVRRDGEWVFIELNPNGQWGWIEGHTGVPIAAALAETLRRGRTHDGLVLGS